MSIYKYVRALEGSLSESGLLTTQNWYLSYLALMGIPLLISLPVPTRIDQLLEPKLNFLDLFSTIATLLLVLYAMNMGVAYAKSSPSASLFALALPVAMLGLLSVPYWTIYQGLTTLALERLFLALLYLICQGFCWAYGGLLIALRWPSEIMQFNMKYACLALVLMTTFFVLQPLNPFLMLSLWFSAGPLHGQGVFLSVGYGGLLAILMILLIWTSKVRNKTNWNKEPR